jgi:hypothetical protein
MGKNHDYENIAIHLSLMDAQVRQGVMETEDL